MSKRSSVGRANTVSVPRNASAATHLTQKKWVSFSRSLRVFRPLSANINITFSSPESFSIKKQPYIFSTCAKSSSTGVSLPNMLTCTFTFCLSISICSIVPVKFANGPSLTRTFSFSSKST